MQDPNEYLVQALKAKRRARGWSLEQTAQETGVSKAMLGQIERGESSPTLATLWKIATGFDVALSEFTDPLIAGAGGELRQAERLRHQPTQDLMLVASLFPYDAAFGFELFELTLPPGYERNSEPHAKGVTEHVIVIRGQMEVLIDGQWQRMREGDAVRFVADRAHGYRNLTQSPAVFHNLIHYPQQRK
ncbi:DNA-binding protein [Marinobacterium zhoushanense]|uniref:DNA-binding protein n=1 Tax=Marinobacterium zhoushanense TaxID=1679163 RepID=A0ABQ1KHB1_9GAMM|nr:XRE family transcriptional regulator [Marinobacterium zhoushanense]GGB95861.1 DNA-binding protein [Marinobacterium zhoushanense]